MRSSAQRALRCCAGLIVALAACTQAPRPALEYVASVGSTAPELSEGADGDVYLSWVETQGAESGAPVAERGFDLVWHLTESDP